MKTCWSSATRAKFLETTKKPEASIEGNISFRGKTTGFWVKASSITFIFLNQCLAKLTIYFILMN